MAEQIPFDIAENVLTKLGSTAFQEIGSIYGVKEELKNLGDRLVTVKAALLDAEEQQKRKKTHVVANWMERLKSVVQDADQLLEDFAKEDLRRRTDRRGRFISQVSDFFSSHNHLVFRFKMSKRIEDVKERLDQVSNDMSSSILNFLP